MECGWFKANYCKWNLEIAELNYKYSSSHNSDSFWLELKKKYYINFVVSYILKMTS